MYSRWFFSRPSRTSRADLVLQLELGKDLLGPVQDLLEPLLDVEGLEDLDLPLDRQVRRVAGRVGDLTGVGQAAEEVGDLGDAAGLDDVLHHRPVFARERERPLGGDLGVGTGFELHPRGLAGPGDAGPDDGANDAADDEGFEAAAQPAHVLHLGDGADLRVARADPGHEQELAARGLGGGECAAGLVGLDREGHDHARQDHARGERQERQDLGVELCHVGFSSEELSRPNQRAAQARYSPRCKQDYRPAAFSPGGTSVSGPRSRRRADIEIGIGRRHCSGRPILESRCSSASPTEPVASWSSPRKRRGCSTTTTSGPSTSCSASCASGTVSPPRRSTA